MTLQLICSQKDYLACARRYTLQAQKESDDMVRMGYAFKATEHYILAMMDIVHKCLDAKVKKEWDSQKGLEQTSFLVQTAHDSYEIAGERLKTLNALSDLYVQMQKSQKAIDSAHLALHNQEFLVLKNDRRVEVFQIIGLKAEGTWGKVYLIYNCTRAIFEILKVSNIEELKKRAKARMELEVKNLMGLNPERFLGFPNPPTHFFHMLLEDPSQILKNGKEIMAYVTAQCNEGNLEIWLKRRRKELNETLCLVACQKLTDIVEHMFKKGYNHRDLSARNILVHKSGKDQYDFVITDWETLLRTAEILKSQWTKVEKKDYETCSHYYTTRQDVQKIKEAAEKNSPKDYLMGVRRADLYALGINLYHIARKGMFYPYKFCSKDDFPLANARFDAVKLEDYHVLFIKLLRNMTDLNPTQRIRLGTSFFEKMKKVIGIATLKLAE